MNLVASENISFEEAIAFTQELINKMSNMSEAEKESAIKSLVNSSNGARGFFVTYLTSDNSIVDENSQGVVQGLVTSPKIVGDLLVKNVAMSTAMRVYHLRNDDPKMSKSSARVATRCQKLMNLLNLEIIDQKLDQLKDSIENNQGEYQSFLKRFGYDQEQKQEILTEITEYLS